MWASAANEFWMEFTNVGWELPSSNISFKASCVPAAKHMQTQLNHITDLVSSIWCLRVGGLGRLDQVEPYIHTKDDTEVLKVTR